MLLMCMMFFATLDFSFLWFAYNFLHGPGLRAGISVRPGRPVIAFIRPCKIANLCYNSSRRRGCRRRSAFSPRFCRGESVSVSRIRRSVSFGPVAQQDRASAS